MNIQISQPAIRTIQPDRLTKLVLLSIYKPENIVFDLYGTPTIDGPELEAICLHGTTVNLYEALNQNLISSAEAHIEWEWLTAKEDEAG